MFCTSCGHQLGADAAFCPGCGKPVAPAVSLEKPAGGMPRYQEIVGSYNNGMPEGVKGWSWGAFLLNWVWAIGNRTWIGLLALVPYIGVIVSIWLGIKGREMAWKNKEWASVEEFNRVQRKWSQWGVGLTLGAVLVGMAAAIVIPAYERYHRHAEQKASDDAVAAAVEAPQSSGTDGMMRPAALRSVSDTSASGEIDSNADTLPTTLATVAGTLALATGSDSNHFMTLDGKRLFSGDDANWQFPVKSFKLSQGREAILMSSTGGRGNACESMYFFLLADASGLRATPEFGTCSPVGNYRQQGDIVTLVLPKMGGNTTVVLDDGIVREDGQAVALNDLNDPAK